MPDRSTEKISVNVDAATKRALRRLAHSRSLDRDEQVTVSDLVNEALEEYLADRQPARRAAEEPGRYRAKREL